MKTKQAKRKTANAYWTLPETSKIVEAGFYYGFNPIDVPKPEKQDQVLAQVLSKESENADIPEWIAMIRAHCGGSAPFLPCMFMRRGRRKTTKSVEYAFDILGTSRAIADALLVKMAYEVAKDEHLENISVEINSLGDRDSVNRWSRELTAYFRKHINDLHPDCRQLFKKDCQAIVSCQHEKCRTIKEEAPHPINYLSEPSRKHFMEVLEFLEAIGIPYTVSNFLVGNQAFAAHTVFKITGTDRSGTYTLAEGGRWGGLAKKMGMKRDVPSVSVKVCLRHENQKVKRRIPLPKCYFLQMGQEAKLKSLDVIEILRRANIPVYHSLTRDKLTAQLMSAEYLKVPYILIMGQKESLENTVLVRNMANRCQETVKICDLPRYLKKVLK
jgi:histidyl-tRNA synthetase